LIPGAPAGARKGEDNGLYGDGRVDSTDEIGTRHWAGAADRSNPGSLNACGYGVYVCELTAPVSPRPCTRSLDHRRQASLAQLGRGVLRGGLGGWVIDHT
jgi:hypothetical protein